MSQACSILTLLSSRASQIEVPAGASISAPWGQYSAWGSILITGMTDLLSDQKSGKGLHALAGQGLLDAAVHALGGEGLRALGQRLCRGLDDGGILGAHAGTQGVDQRIDGCALVRGEHIAIGLQSAFGGH